MGSTCCSFALISGRNEACAPLRICRKRGLIVGLLWSLHLLAYLLVAPP